LVPHSIYYVLKFHHSLSEHAFYSTDEFYKTTSQWIPLYYLVYSCNLLLLPYLYIIPCKIVSDCYCKVFVTCIWDLLYTIVLYFIFIMTVSISYRSFDLVWINGNTNKMHEWMNEYFQKDLIITVSHHGSRLGSAYHVIWIQTIQNQIIMK
jgi:hypothetical protein